jgi:hypothetical protein
MSRWVALLAASLSWLFAHHHYVSPEPLLQWGLIALAVAAAVPAFSGQSDRVRMPLACLVLLVPLGAVLSLAEPGARPAVWVLCAGVAAAALLGRRGPRVLRASAVATLAVGVVLAAQAPVFGWVTAWTARHQDLPLAASALHGLLSWVGFDVSLSGDVLFVRTMRDVHAFPLSWSHLAPVPLSSLWLGGVLLLWWRRRRRSFLTGLVGLSLLLALYSLVRLLLLVLVFASAMLFVDYEAESVHVEVFWLPWITALSFVPLLPFLGRWLPLAAEASGPAQDADATKVVVEPVTAASLEPESWDRPRLRAVVLALVAVGCMGITLGNHYWEPGVPKQGRVLLDEAHSEWERSDNAYDTDWYGSESGYNYYCMAEYLGHHYALDRNLEGALTPEKLAGYDVLLLKTPTRACTDAELDAIEAFVRGGGGLFAFGEHTNVFGSSVYLNPVLRRFGMAVRYDSVFDIERKWEQLRFFPALGVSPIAQHVPFFRFAVSCSIASGSWDVRPVIRSTGLWSLPIEYAAGNFYPHVADSTSARFGAFDQMVAATPGAGRVVLFADSTVYSNFLAFQPGKPELLLGAMEWLNRSNGPTDIRLWLLLGGAGALALAFLIWAFQSPALAFLAAAVALGTGASWLALALCAWRAEADYPAATPDKPIQRVVLDLDYGTVELPLFGFTQQHRESYEIFHQWILRLGYFPTVSLPVDAHPPGSMDLTGALSAEHPVIVVKPDRPFAPEVVEQARAFLAGGGSLLVLESTLDPHSTANELTAPFGLQFGERAQGSQVIEAGTGSRICTVTSGRKVSGGTALLRTERDEPILAWTRVGEGQLIAAGLAERFVNTAMGVSDRQVPDLAQRAVFELQFALMRGLVENDLPAHMTSLGETYTREE